MKVRIQKILEFFNPFMGSEPPKFRGSAKILIFPLNCNNIITFYFLLVSYIRFLENSKYIDPRDILKDYLSGD